MRSGDLNKLRKPKSLIENRVGFAGPHSELCIYDTYANATRVGLKADQLLYCGMMTGRKIIHSHRNEPVSFLPHESFVMAPGEQIEIDFPDAKDNQPTTCLTVEISREKVSSVSNKLIDLALFKDAIDAWGYGARSIHIHHTTATQQLLSRLVTIFAENEPDRDAMIDLGISELIIRLLRHQTRDFLLAYSLGQPDANGLTTALEYISKHLAQPLDIDYLSKISCMSRSRLYAEFKRQLGCSPGELQQQLRLKEAAKLIENGKIITQVCYELGFSNPSHFSRRFSQFFGCSPKEFKKRALNKQQLDMQNPLDH